MADHNRFGFIVMLMIIYLLLPYSTPVTRRDEAEQAIRNAKRQLHELQNSTYGVPGNITGLEGVGKPDANGTVRRIPPESVRKTVAEMIRDVLGNSANDFTSGAEMGTLAPSELAYPLPTRNNYEGPNDSIDISPLPSPDGATEAHLLRRDIPILENTDPIYHNASGGMYGEWQRAYDLEPYQLTNSTNVEKNITGNHGRLLIRVEESKPGSVQEVEARISIENEDRFTSHDIIMYGAHLVGTGEMVLTTTSREFNGLFALPHFARTKEAFEDIRQLWNESLTEAIRRQENSPDLNPLLTQKPEFGSPHQCEYIAYLQLHPIHSPPPAPIPYPTYDPRFWFHYLWDPEPITSDVLREIEQELRHPTGAPLPPAPPIIVSSVIYSPNCGYVLQSNEAKGLKIEMFHSKVQNFALSASFLVGVQIWLLIRQMNESSTPSTVSRVSFWSILIMAIVDGYIAGAFILVSALVESSYLALLTAAFLSLVLVIIFGMRFLMLIWGIQRPERRAAENAAAAAAAADAPPTAQPAPPGTPLELPAPATAQTPLINTEGTNNNAPQDLSSVYYRFWFALLGGAFLFLHVASWPPPHRHIFVTTFTFLASSFWVPQVYRNVMRGCRKAFSWEYILGTSACRLVPVLYLMCYSDNIFMYEGEWKVGVGVVAWVALQVGVMWVQEVAGPRVFVPGNILPPAYDYHPILPIDDLEAAQPFSSTSSTDTPSPSSSSQQPSSLHHHARTGLRSFDCAICMHPVDVLTSSPPNSGGGGSGASGSGGGSGGGLSSAGGFGGLTTRRSYMVTPCRHVFHAPCLEGWMRFRLQCPICRNQLPPL